MLRLTLHPAYFLQRRNFLWRRLLHTHGQQPSFRFRIPLPPQLFELHARFLSASSSKSCRSGEHVLRAACESYRMSPFVSVALDQKKKTMCMPVSVSLETAAVAQQPSAKTGVLETWVSPVLPPDPPASLLLLNALTYQGTTRSSLGTSPTAAGGCAMVPRVTGSHSSTLCPDLCAARINTSKAVTFT